MKLFQDTANMKKLSEMFADTGISMDEILADGSAQALTNAVKLKANEWAGESKEAEKVAEEETEEVETEEETEGEEVAEGDAVETEEAEGENEGEEVAPEVAEEDSPVAQERKRVLAIQDMALKSQSELAQSLVLDGSSIEKAAVAFMQNAKENEAAKADEGQDALKAFRSGKKAIKVAEEATKGEDGPITKQWNAIEDATERSKFFQKNQEAIAAKR